MAANNDDHVVTSSESDSDSGGYRTGDSNSGAPASGPGELMLHNSYDLFC